jgi:hypothetical protein
VFPRQFVEPAIVDTWTQITRMRADYKRRLGQCRFAESTPQNVVENRLKRLPRLTGQFPYTFGEIVFKGYSRPHAGIMMPIAHDVKMTFGGRQRQARRLVQTV